ncbi:MAG: nuclear transport factor 2 family protein [Gemmatimonadaceae bacterium]
MSEHLEHHTEIDALYASWREVFARGDVDRVFEMLTADYELWAPGAPPATREHLAPALAAAFKLYHVDSTFEREELLVNGDLAVDMGWDVQLLRPVAGGDPVQRRQRVFLVLRRGDDGRWRFARGMSQPGPTAS